MAIPEPADALWAEVSKFSAWPDSDEDAARAISAGWRSGGERFAQAGAFDLSPVADGWTDRAGQDFHGRTAEGLRSATATGAGMAELAGHADNFAAEVAGVKNGIHSLMAANQAGWAQAATMPADAQATFVREVAGLVDQMKAAAAARISAAGGAMAQPVQLAREQAPPGPPTGGDPRAVLDWWNGLGPEGRDYYRARPELIGNLDGVPAFERSKANLAVLDATIATPGLTPDRLAALKALKDQFSVVEPGSPNERLLIGFDNAGDGQAIVSIGNPDTAKNVATLVPGIGNDLGSVPEQVARANSLRAGSDTAAIVWLDYNPPELPNGPDGLSLTSLTDDRADAAKGDLAEFQNGLRATHVGEPSHNVVVAHSYGTTVAGLAASKVGLNADQLVLVASTGPGVRHVSDLQLLNPDGTEVPKSQLPLRVFATTAGDDTLAHLGSLGRDPSDPYFGARILDTASGSPNPHQAPFEAGPTLDALKYIVNVGFG